MECGVPSVAMALPTSPEGFNFTCMIAAVNMKGTAHGV